MIIRCNNNLAPAIVTENSFVLRYDILLPKSLVSCIVVGKKGLADLSGTAAFHPNNHRNAHHALSKPVLPPHR
jgi:hypothetical protein